MNNPKRFAPGHKSGDLHGSLSPKARADRAFHLYPKNKGLLWPFLLFTLLFLSGCSGWSQEQKDAFITGCTQEGGTEMTEACECTLEALSQTYTQSEDFTALSEAEQLKAIITASGEQNCLTWEHPTVAESFLSGCKEEEGLGSAKSTEAFCGCALEKVKVLEPNPMAMALMEDTRGEKLFEDKSVMACFSWEIVEEEVFDCKGPGTPAEEAAFCECALGKIKAKYVNAGAFMQAMTEKPDQAEALILETSKGCF